MFVGDSGLKVIANSKYVIVDGMVEEKLVLTMLMGYHNGITISCAYYLAELKTHDFYLLFFQAHTTLSPLSAPHHLVFLPSFFSSLLFASYVHVKTNKLSYNNNNRKSKTSPIVKWSPQSARCTLRISA
jgi:hypothetical protein